MKYKNGMFLKPSSYYKYWGDWIKVKFKINKFMSFGRMSAIEISRDAKKLPNSKNYADEILFKTDNVRQKVDAKNKC